MKNTLRIHMYCQSWHPWSKEETRLWDKRCSNHKSWCRSESSSSSWRREQCW